MKSNSQKNAIIILTLIIAAIIFAVLIKLPRQSIELVSNNDESIKLSFDSTLEFVFENISQAQKSSAVVAFNSPIEYAISWEDNILKVVPKILDLNTNYDIYIFINAQIFAQKSYQTIDYEELSEEEKVKYSALKLTINKDNQLSLLEEKPWLDKLPIINDDYLITYDVEENYYRVRIWNSDSLSESQIENIKEDALYDLVQVDASSEEDLIFILD